MFILIFVGGKKAVIEWSENAVVLLQVSIFKTKNVGWQKIKYNKINII